MRELRYIAIMALVVFLMAPFLLLAVSIMPTMHPMQRAAIRMAWAEVKRVAWEIVK